MKNFKLLSKTAIVARAFNRLPHLHKLNIAPQPNISTKAQNLHFCPYCYKPLLAEVAVNLQGFNLKTKQNDLQRDFRN